ncbi:hypothetical protein LWC34_52435 [Kibdelosporangium philippinense]|uniref:Uncharacterized protein n=1 Tax=Kibdelosporangium philippinense TaxID=211113 RepID=A0ABS8ZUU8_9PSEU|nr:hypothetical protein [Kibdelosporangium philippinense]MCE7011364.1 hypothetical protein [Kibdelosporangium philippinense]
MTSIPARFGLALTASLLATSACSGDPAKLDEVKTAVTKTMATTAEHIETQVMQIGDEGSLTWTTRADVNGPANAYRAVSNHTADPPSLLTMMTADSSVAGKDLRAEVLRVGITLYMTMPGWPQHLRGRWLPFPLASAESMLEAQGVQIAGETRSPSRLLALVDSANANVTRSGSTYELTVPARKAVSVLGVAAARRFANGELDVDMLQGNATVEVVVDSEGRIESMELDATDLMEQIMTMSGVRLPSDGVPTKLDLKVANYGKPVSVAVPPDTQLIDQSEMPR